MYLNLHCKPVQGCESMIFLRCQVATLAEGKDWSMETSPARNWTSPQPKTGLSSSHR